ncbi:MAG: hypothetical protein ACI4W6_03260 [Acutalibacteraceae bacterium]
MKSSSFYDLNEVSYSDRETFNNTIVLLSMVKSEAYYIIGFSRLDKIIEIGFDFESSFHSIITEEIHIDLNHSDCIHFRCVLRNLNYSKKIKKLLDSASDSFFAVDNDIVYERSFARDRIVPISIDDIDLLIKRVKNEIIEFIELCYEKGI